MSFRRVISFWIVASFFLTSLGPYPKAHADTVLALPAPGTMVNLSPAYEPALIKGLTVHKDNPFLFDFIVDIGNSGLSGDDLKKEGDRLVKYFFACLTIPEKDLWVNLSPYEKDRMVPQALGQTALGRDLLAQDYILKQLTASLIYPEKDLGKAFWDRVYAKARQMYGTTQIPVNTFNKVWIVADKASVYEHGQTAFVVDGHLKVMLEEDYLALNKNVSKYPMRQQEPSVRRDEHFLDGDAAISDKKIALLRPVDSARNDTYALASQIVRAIILPEIEKEVNTGKNFSTLRQIFNSLILASWYKKNFKEALLNEVYADKSTINGVIASGAKQSREQIYKQYLKAYKKGVFNYIKEDAQPDGQTIPRKYFSGGFVVSPAMVSVVTDKTPGSQAMVSRVLGKMVATFVLTVGLLINQANLPAMPGVNFPVAHGQVSQSFVNQSVAQNTAVKPIDAAMKSDKLPQYGDKNYWPGRMKVGGVVLDNIGLILLKDRQEGGMSRQWNYHPFEPSSFRQIYPRFADAPSEVIDILAQRFSHPARAHGEILSYQQNVYDLVESLRLGSGVNDVDSHIERLSQLINEFSNERYKFYKQLEIMRYSTDAQYLSKHRQLRVVFGGPTPSYPLTTKAIIALGRMIAIAVILEGMLPSNAQGIVKEWKDDLRKFLSNSDIQFFVKHSEFLKYVSSYDDPYIFSEEKYGIENAQRRQRMLAELVARENRKIEMEGIPSDLQGWVNDEADLLRTPPSIEDFLPGKGGSQGYRDERFRKVREEFFDILKRYEDLWVINTDQINKRKEQLKQGRKKSGAPDQFSFLRQFPDGLIKKTLAPMDFHAHVSLMILNDGYQFPQITQPDGQVFPTGTVRLDSYKNPLLTKGSREIRQTNDPLDALFKILEPASSRQITAGLMDHIHPLSIDLDPEQSALLLSGPNMGGKTTTARGIAMAVLASQAGLPLSVKNANMAPFKNIYTLFPRPEQLQKGYGYFGSLMDEFSSLIKKVNSGDLVVLDEVPTGTDYLELVAVTTVLLEDLIKTGATVIVTGHLKKAFELIAQRTGQTPLMHTTTEVGGEMVPDYKLQPGVAKHSYAIELLKRAGFPESIQNLARQYYSLITERKEFPQDLTPLTPDELKVAKTKISPAIKIETEDQGAVRSVMRSLYPNQYFAFGDHTQDQLLKIFTDVRDFGLEMEQARRALQGLKSIEEKPEPGADQKKREAEERMRLTKLFVDQGEGFLIGMNKLLKPMKFFILYPAYDVEEKIARLVKLQKMLLEISQYIQPMEHDPKIKRILELFNSSQEPLAELETQYQNIKGEVFKKSPEEQLLWHQIETNLDLMKEQLMQELMNIDMYTGIARSILKYHLKQPHLVVEPNILTLNNSKPFFPQPFSSSPFVENAVEQSFAMDPNKPVMVLTGPNSSGKSVLMFNSWVNALFALNGFYVSGDLGMSRFDNVFLFMGGRDYVVSGESYFMNILKRYAKIIKDATPNSLVVLDELHGTDNFELAAIQLAVLHYFRALNVSVIFNTHIRDGLKALSDKIGLDLWKTDVVFKKKENNIQPLYTVSRDPNLEAKSYGFLVAKQWLTEGQYHRATQIYDQLSHDAAMTADRPTAEVYLRTTDRRLFVSHYADPTDPIVSFLLNMIDHPLKNKDDILQRQRSIDKLINQPDIYKGSFRKALQDVFNWLGNFNWLLEEERRTIRIVDLISEGMIKPQELEEKIKNIIEKDKIKQPRSEFSLEEEAYLRLARIKENVGVIDEFVTVVKELNDPLLSQMAEDFKSNYLSSGLGEIDGHALVAMTVQKDYERNLEQVQQKVEKVSEFLYPLAAFQFFAVHAKAEEFAKATFNEDQPVSYKGGWNFITRKDEEKAFNASFEDKPIVAYVGSNMSGKSYKLKTDFMIQKLGQAFGYVPAEVANLRIYDHIAYLDRPSTESTQNLSAFGREVEDWIPVEKAMGPRSLIFVDEGFSTTSPEDQARLLRGVAGLIKHEGARLRIASHNEGFLNALTQDQDAVLYQFVVDKRDGGIRYTYKMEKVTEGIGDSDALAVARQQGLPEALLSRAERYLNGESQPATKLKDRQPPKIFRYSSVKREEFKRKTGNFMGFFPNSSSVEIVSDEGSPGWGNKRGLNKTKYETPQEARERERAKEYEYGSRKRTNKPPIPAIKPLFEPFSRDREFTKDAFISGREGTGALSDRYRWEHVEAITTMFLSTQTTDPREILERQQMFRELLKSDDRQKINKTLVDLKNMILSLSELRYQTEGFNLNLLDQIISGFKDFDKIGELKWYVSILSTVLKMNLRISKLPENELGIDKDIERIQEIVSKFEEFLNSIVEYNRKENETTNHDEFRAWYNNEYKPRHEAIINRLIELGEIKVDPEMRGFYSPELKTVIDAVGKIAKSVQDKLKDRLVPADLNDPAVWDIASEHLDQVYEDAIDIRSATFTLAQYAGLIIGYKHLLDKRDYLSELVSELRKYDSVHLQQWANYFEEIIGHWLGKYRRGRDILQFNVNAAAEIAKMKNEISETLLLQEKVRNGEVDLPEQLTQTIEDTRNLLKQTTRDRDWQRENITGDAGYTKEKAEKELPGLERQVKILEAISAIQEKRSQLSIGGTVSIDEEPVQVKDVLADTILEYRISRFRVDIFNLEHRVKSWDNYFNKDSADNIIAELGKLGTLMTLVDIMANEGWKPVELTDKMDLELKNGWSLTKPKDEQVPLSLTMDGQSRITLLSGSNMSGKTFAEKNLMWQIMIALSTGFSPAEHLKLPIFEKLIYLDRVTHQDDYTLSAFGNEIKYWNQFFSIAQRAKGPIFAETDEMGSTTSPRYQGALAYAFTEEMLSQGHFLVAASHHHEYLKDFVNNNSERTRIYHFETQLNTDGNVVFTHQIRAGHAESNSLNVARTMGLTKIVEFAPPVTDSAMRTNQTTEAFPGGIDLNTSNGMQWKVSKDGQGVEMNLDPATIKRLKRDGVTWLSPVIFKMTPVTSVWPLVGFKAPESVH